MKYENIWNAVDKLAEINGLSPSGLAKKAGLDATTFNKSKRVRADGNKRFPSLESLYKIVEACNISLESFYSLANNSDSASIEKISTIPYIKFSNIKSGDIAKENWTQIQFPDNKHNIYAIKINSNDTPYEENTVTVLSKNSDIRHGDMILINKKTSSIFGRFLNRSAKSIEISKKSEKEEVEIINIEDITRIDRVLWISQ